MRSPMDSMPRIPAAQSDVESQHRRHRCLRLLVRKSEITNGMPLYSRAKTSAQDSLYSSRHEAAQVACTTHALVHQATDRCPARELAYLAPGLKATDVIEHGGHLSKGALLHLPSMHCVQYTAHMPAAYHPKVRRGRSSA